MMRVAAAILAAGASRRLGRPKQLLPYRDTTLLRAVAVEVCAAACDHVIVIVGAYASAVSANVAGLPLSVVRNIHWREGVASSIRRAISWAVRAEYDGLALIVCDQPRLTRAHLDRLIALHRVTGRPAASRYDGIVGVPAVFGAHEFAALATLTGDVGARRLLASSAVATIDWPDGIFDIDSEAQARCALEL
jgi:CTP:molybdopterin cytidylyltransferase MocA